MKTTILESFKDNFEENINLSIKKYNIDEGDGDFISYNFIDDNYSIYFKNKFNDDETYDKVIEISLREDKWITEEVITDEIKIENLFIASINPVLIKNRTYLQM